MRDHEHTHADADAAVRQHGHGSHRRPDGGHAPGQDHGPAHDHDHAPANGPGHDHGRGHDYAHGAGNGHDHGSGHGHDHGPGHGHDHGPGHGHGDDPALAAMLDVDAQVMAPVLADLVEQVAEQAGPGAQRVVDLGAGTGVGTVALARRLPDAEVAAVDRSPTMLERVLAAARAAGVEERVRTLEADLGDGWPDTGPLDLVWASSSLHELPDVAPVLRGAAEVLAPHGSVAVVEVDTLPRFLPDDLGRGRPGLEVRCHEVLARAGWNRYQDWTSYLTAVGLEVSRHRRVLQEQPPAELLTRYARAFLQRIRGYVGPHLPADDVAVLDVLLASGPESLERRGDLVFQASRTLWLAHRP